MDICNVLISRLFVVNAAMKMKVEHTYFLFCVFIFLDKHLEVKL